MDFVVCGIMVSLLGFHWVFLPSLMGEMVPLVNVMPFWTGAVFVVGMGQQWSQNQQAGAQQPVAMGAFSPMFVPPVQPAGNAQTSALPHPAPAQPPSEQQPAK